MKKSSIERSKFGKIHLVEILDIVFDSMLVTIPTFLGYFNIDKIPFTDIQFSWNLVLWGSVLTFVSTFLGLFIKKYGSNSKNEFLKKEDI